VSATSFLETPVEIGKDELSIRTGAAGRPELRYDRAMKSLRLAYAVASVSLIVLTAGCSVSSESASKPESTQVGVTESAVLAGTSFDVRRDPG
jgi:hypothetical protein